MDAPQTLLIVYHSLTGGTRQMAEAARAGAAAEPAVSVRLLHAAQAGGPVAWSFRWTTKTTV